MVMVTREAPVLPPKLTHGVRQRTLTFQRPIVEDLLLHQRLGLLEPPVPAAIFLEHDGQNSDILLLKLDSGGSRRQQGLANGRCGLTLEPRGSLPTIPSKASNLTSNEGHQREVTQQERLCQRCVQSTLFANVCLDGAGNDPPRP